jgi:hypothetical protein
VKSASTLAKEFRLVALVAIMSRSHRIPGGAVLMVQISPQSLFFHKGNVSTSIQKCQLIENLNRYNKQADLSNA